MHDNPPIADPTDPTDPTDPIDPIGPGNRVEDDVHKEALAATHEAPIANGSSEGDEDGQARLV